MRWNRWGAGVVAAATVLVVTGCGSSSGAGSTTSAATGAASAAGSGTTPSPSSAYSSSPVDAASSSTPPSATTSASELVGTGSGGIVVYNAQHENLTQAWAEAFTRQTGIPVEMRNGSDTELANQLAAEGSGSPADVLLTENSPGMNIVENAGLFAPVDAATVAQVPSRYNPSTGNWVGIAARSTVFVYNPSLLAEADLPASIMDLQDASWQGKWAASPSGADFQAIVSAILQTRGVDATTAWLDGMKANATAYRGNTTVMMAVKRR